MDPSKLRAIIAALPGDLALWHAGPDALPTVLKVLSMRRVERLAREGTHPALQAPAHLRLETRSEDRFRHAAASIVTWSSRHLRDDVSLVAPEASSSATRGRRKRRRAIERRVTMRDFEAASDLAWDWQQLEVVEMGLGAGDLTVREARGRHVWIDNHRRADVEALDLVLAQVTALGSAATEVDIAETRNWFEANRGRADRINLVPESIRRAAWTDARSLLMSQGTTIPATTDLGGVTLDEARACYAVLLAQLFLTELGTVHLGSEQALLWGIKEVNLTKLLARYVEERAAGAFVDLCKCVPGRSPLSAPLVPHGDLLLVPTALVTPIAFERTLLRAASADPGRSGPLGKVLGDRARRWAERLASIPGCRIAERVKVKDASGRTLGDLDVVAWDRARSLAVVFETKWPVDAASLSESYKVDSHFASGREQVRRLRAIIESGDAAISWPQGWDLPFAETHFHWWVGSAQQLDSSPNAESHGISSTSLRLVENLLPQPDLSAFVEALEHFPMPRRGTEFDLIHQTVRAGPLVLHVEALAIHDAPSPPPERRTSAGWT